MRLGLTALRVVVGGAFAAHGAQKLFGWFGGPGPDALGQGFEQMGIRPGKRNAVIAGASELGGGAMIATGFLTPLGAAAIVDIGPGPVSLDRALGTEKSGPFWALAALAAGLAGPRLLERFAPEAAGEHEAQPEPQRFVRDRESVSAPAPAQRTA